VRRFNILKPTIVPQFTGILEVVPVKLSEGFSWFCLFMEGVRRKSEEVKSEKQRVVKMKTD
jgi:hypothetical protein